MKRYSTLLLALFLAACGGSSTGPKEIIGTGLPKTHPDTVVMRSISLSHPESGERLNIIYFHDGRYDPRALMAINRLFRDRRANVTGTIDPELIDFLVDIRSRLMLPPTVTFEILSGYRTAATNRMLAQHNSHVAIESLHVRGWAVDFRMEGVDGRAITAIAKTMQRGGMAYYPADNHVHVDIGNIRTWHTK